jgi:hypothetical protein
MNVDRGEKAFLEIVSGEEEERACIECKSDILALSLKDDGDSETSCRHDRPKY